MAYKHFVKIRLSKDDTLEPKHINAVQDNVETALHQVLDKDILDRIPLPKVLLIPGQVNYVAHKLGRAVQGYNVIRRFGDVRVWDATGTNLSPDRLLPLMASATGYVQLEVF